MEEAVGLMGPGIHRKPADHAAMLDFQDLQAQGFADGVSAQGAELVAADAAGKGGVLRHLDKFNR